MSVPALTYPTRLLDVVRDTLGRADFVVDLVPDTIIHRPLRDELKQAGARILTICEPPDALERMFPTPEITAEVMALRDRLAAASRLHVGSEGGTDLSFDLARRSRTGRRASSTSRARGITGRAALVTGYPDDDTARGTWVLSPETSCSRSTGRRSAGRAVHRGGIHRGDHRRARRRHPARLPRGL